MPSPGESLAGELAAGGVGDKSLADELAGVLLPCMAAGDESESLADELAPAPLPCTAAGDESLADELAPAPLPCTAAGDESLADELAGMPLPCMSAIRGACSVSATSRRRVFVTGIGVVAPGVGGGGVVRVHGRGGSRGLAPGRAVRVSPCPSPVTMVSELTDDMLALDGRSSNDSVVAELIVDLAMSLPVSRLLSPWAAPPPATSPRRAETFAAARATARTSRAA